MRHGNTEYNSKSIIMGQIDSPLTEKGLKIPEILSKKIKNVKFDHVYSSDLGRAFITSYMMIEQLNIEPKLNRAKELREINYGIYTHKKKEEVKKICPEYKTDVSFIFPEGESFLQLQKRIVKFIKLLEKKHKNEIILLVTHAGVIRAFKTYFKNKNLEQYINKKIPHEYIGKFVIENGKLISYEKINS